MDYWENHYKQGGNSGEGSVGKLRQWKWNTISKYQPNLNDVIDVGCGDLSFWGDKELPEKYIGIDISESIIEKNKLKRPKSNFIISNGEIAFDLHSNNVFCFDMLFHIMNDSEYTEIINNLCKYSNKYIFIYTWLVNPMKKCYYIPQWICYTETDNRYQKYRNISFLFDIMRKNNFSCIGLEQNQSIDKYGALFIFKKCSNDIISK